MLTPIRQRFLSAIGRLTGLRDGGVVNPCGEIPAITHPPQPDAPEVDADELARLFRLASEVEVSTSGPMEEVLRQVIGSPDTFIGIDRANEPRDYYTVDTSTGPAPSVELKSNPQAPRIPLATGRRRVRME